MAGLLRRTPRVAGSPYRSTQPLNFSLGQDGGRSEGPPNMLQQAFQSMLAAGAMPNVTGGPADILRAADAGMGRVAQINTEYAQKAMQQRQLELEDIDVQQKMMQMGRPVIGGAVEEDQAAPDVPGSAIPAGTPIKVARPADKSRVVKHKTLDGRTIEIELYTPDEQIAMASRKRILEKQAEIAAEVQKQAALQQLGITPDKVAEINQQGRVNAAQTAAEAAAKRAADEQAAISARAAEYAKNTAALQEDRQEFQKQQAEQQRAFQAQQNAANRAISGVGTRTPLPPDVEEQRKRIRASQREIGDLSPAEFSKVQSLASEFDRRPDVRAYNESVVRAETVKSLTARGLGGPGDLATIFEFMRALDPTSVVRESEYREAAKSGNIFAGWAARFNGYLKPEGGFLPKNVAEAFGKILSEKMKIAGDRVSKIRKDYGRRINLITHQQDGEQYLTDYVAIGDQPAAQAPAGTPKATKRYNPQTGQLEPIQ